MTINIKVAVPETANWRALVVLQDRSRDDAGKFGDYADVARTFVIPGTEGEFTGSETRRVLVERVELANDATDTAAVNAEADTTTEGSESGDVVLSPDAEADEEDNGPKP